MVKNLLEQDAVNQPDEVGQETEKTTGAPTFETAAAPQYVEVNEAEDLLEPSETTVAEKPEDAEKIELPAETADETLNLAEENSSPAENSFDATKDAPDDFEPPVEAANETPNFAASSDNLDPEAKTVAANTIFQTPAEPQSFAETARQSGLAYAAALTLFASVVFMLIIGWFADLLFGSSPWGKVIGIVLGALIGFVQLFRITSQIFKK